MSSPEVWNFLTEKEFDDAKKDILRDYREYGDDNSPIPEFSNEYFFVKEGIAPEDAGFGDYETVRYRVIRHIESGKLYRIDINYDSWSSFVNYASLGSRGEHYEVEPVEVIEYKAIKK